MLGLSHCGLRAMTGIVELGLEIARCGVWMWMTLSLGLFRHLGFELVVEW
jgi:hypothetical protein